MTYFPYQYKSSELIDIRGNVGHDIKLGFPQMSSPYISLEQEVALYFHSIASTYYCCNYRNQWWIQRGGTPGTPPPPPKIGKNMIFCIKSWFYTQNTPKMFATRFARRNFFNAPIVTWNRGSAPWNTNPQSPTRSSPQPPLQKPADGPDIAMCVCGGGTMTPYLL